MVAASRGTIFAKLASLGLTNSESLDLGTLATERKLEVSNFFCKSEKCCAYMTTKKRFNKKLNKNVDVPIRALRTKTFKFASEQRCTECPDCGEVLFKYP